MISQKDFDDKLQNLNETVTSNKTKYLETKKELLDLTNKFVHKYQKKNKMFVSQNVFYW